MSEWIEVDLTEHEKAQKTLIRGVEVELYASPYDVPEAIRAHFDETKNRFIIEFKYVGSETTLVYVFDHVGYTVGKNSGRLYGMEIDVRALKADGVGVYVGLHQKQGQELAASLRDQVTGAIDYLLERHPLKKVPEDNYKLAKSAVLLKQNELFAVA
jgi:hypothetical protein